jgi:hypothetical protein
MGKQGKREFVQVLRLMEVFRADEVAAAVRDAIARGAIGFDAVCDESTPLEGVMSVGLPTNSPPPSPAGYLWLPSRAQPSP